MIPSAHVIRIPPVSYTHLDVYKRQMHHQLVASALAVSMAHEIDPEFMLGCMLAYHNGYPYTCHPDDILYAPVSYTHLHTEEKDIFYSAVLKIIKHPKPELAGFICACCDAEDIFVSVSYTHLVYPIIPERPTVAAIRITSSIIHAAKGALPFCILWMDVRYTACLLYTSRCV